MFWQTWNISKTNIHICIIKDCWGFSKFCRGCTRFVHSQIQPKISVEEVGFGKLARVKWQPVPLCTNSSALGVRQWKLRRSKVPKSKNLFEINLAWENGSEGHHFGKLLISKFLKGLTHSAVLDERGSDIFFRYSSLLFAFLLITEGLFLFNDLAAGGKLTLVSKENVKVGPMVSKKVKDLFWLASAWQKSMHLEVKAESTVAIFLFYLNQEN